MDERELFNQKQKFFEDKMADIKRKYSGFINNNFDVIF